jgi:hypothetical protein
VAFSAGGDGGRSALELLTAHHAVITVRSAAVSEWPNVAGYDPAGCKSTGSGFRLRVIAIPRGQSAYPAELFAGSTRGHCGRPVLAMPTTWMIAPSVTTPRSANQVRRAKQLSGIATAINKSGFIGQMCLSLASSPHLNSNPPRRSDNAVQKISEPKAMSNTPRGVNGIAYPSDWVGRTRRVAHVCCGVVRNACWDVSELGTTALLPPPKRAIACTS